VRKKDVEVGIEVELEFVEVAAVVETEVAIEVET